MRIPAAVFRLVRVLGLAAAASGLVSGCGLFRKPAKADDRHIREIRAGRTRLGLIMGVDPGGRFVVIRTSFGTLVEDGSLLVSRRGEVRSARLVVCPERQRSFVSADIRDGSPRVGDAVFMVPSSVSGDAEPASTVDGGR
jgi:hypothetical protein